VSTVMNLKFQKMLGGFFSSCITGGFSVWVQLYEVS
jgi:hypothetical protein